MARFPTSPKIGQSYVSNEANSQQLWVWTGYTWEQVLFGTGSGNGATGATGPTGPSGGPVGPQGPTGATGPNIPATTSTLGSVIIGGGISGAVDGTISTDLQKVTDNGYTTSNPIIVRRPSDGAYAKLDYDGPSGYVEITNGTNSVQMFFKGFVNEYGGELLFPQLPYEVSSPFIPVSVNGVRADSDGKIVVSGLGSTGATGPTGAAGTRGSQGHQGSNGDTGATGATG